MNWDNLTYIFQIPIEWYKKIHERVFGAYGTNFIRVKDGDDGGMQIDIDEDAFAQAVNQYASGTVKSVNNTLPDANGNVELTDIVKTVNDIAPDEDGNITISIPAQTVKSVDHKSPDQQGNIQLNAICTINGYNGDSVGNFAGVVTSINGNTPNDGAVTMTVVESVDGVSPDANGDVQLDAVKTVNSISPDASGDVDLGDIVYSVDGLSPDANGDVSFGLAASKWMKTDASGHIATTNETPIALPSGYTGQDSTFTVVTDVIWNGTTLQKKTRQLTYKSGVLTSVGIEGTSTIDTPTQITWS
jgi:hypothetical protein